MPASIRHALLLHGAGGGGWEWNIWRGVLAAGGIDRARPTCSPPPPGLAATTFEDYVQQARAALAALPRPRAVVGASLGGLLAMAAARCGRRPGAGQSTAAGAVVGATACARLAGRVPWQRDARLASTRRAMPDADDATALFAFRHWRDESGAVLRAAQPGSTVRPTGMPGAVRAVGAGRGRAAGVDA